MQFPASVHGMSSTSDGFMMSPISLRMHKLLRVVRIVTLTDFVYGSFYPYPCEMMSCQSVNSTGESFFPYYYNASATFRRNSMQTIDTENSPAMYEIWI